MTRCSLIVAAMLGAVAPAQSFQPAQLRSGTIPGAPVTAIGGGQVVLELSVDRDGRVTAATPLRTTPPYTETLLRAVSDWQFKPAEDDVPSADTSAGEKSTRARVETKVVVAALWLPPSLLVPTHGEAPRDVAPASAQVAFPLTSIAPAFPPRAYGGGVVMLETRVEITGAPGDIKVVRSTPPFDEVAAAAVRQWRFRPARVRDKNVATLVYILVGFRVPV
jgi:TonB family protein